MGRLVDELLRDLHLEEAEDGPATLAVVLVLLTVFACVLVVVVSLA